MSFPVFSLILFGVNICCVFNKPLYKMCKFSVLGGFINQGNVCTFAYTNAKYMWIHTYFLSNLNKIKSNKNKTIKQLWQMCHAHWQSFSYGFKLIVYKICQKSPEVNCIVLVALSEPSRNCVHAYHENVHQKKRSKKSVTYSYHRSYHLILNKEQINLKLHCPSCLTAMCDHTTRTM